MTGNPTNTVIYELMVAARTDEKLRDTLREVMAAYIAKIYEAARAVLSAEEIEAFGEENFAALVAVLINTFDGAAMFGHVLTHPEIEERRIPLLHVAAERRAPIAAFGKLLTLTTGRYRLTLPPSDGGRLRTLGGVVTGSFIIDSHDIGEAEELLTATYTKVRLSEQSHGAPTRTRVWRTRIGSLDVDDFEYSYDLEYDVEPMETILLCRVLKGAIEDHLPGHQPEMFTTGEAAAIGALDGTAFSGFVHRAIFTAISIDRRLLALTSSAPIFGATSYSTPALLRRAIAFIDERTRTPMSLPPTSRRRSM